jgi:hypothetical protein
MRNEAVAFWLVITLATCVTSAFGQYSAAKIQVLPDSVLKLELRGDALRATLTKQLTAGASVKSIVSADAEILKAVRNATEMVGVSSRAFADNRRIYFVLAVATSSVERAGTGFCGAGTEDKLVLIEWLGKARKLVLRDQFEIQSCLKSIALQSDQGGDLLTLLGKVSDPAHLRLTWLQHPKFHQSTKTVTSGKGRFVVTD